MSELWRRSHNLKRLGKSWMELSVSNNLIYAVLREWREGWFLAAWAATTAASHRAIKRVSLDPTIVEWSRDQGFRILTIRVDSHWNGSNIVDMSFNLKNFRSDKLNRLLINELKREHEIIENVRIRSRFPQTASLFC